MRIDYRPEIDGLRAIAVLAVLFYHAEFVINYGTHNSINFLPGGFLGVDIFFVVSGYLITKIILVELLKNEFSFKNFYLNRARRLLPALFLVIIFSIPFSWFYLMPKEMQDYALSVIYSLLFSSNFLFWTENSYFATENLLKPFLHTWSLAIEEQFYLIFPLSLVLIWKFFREKIIAIFIFLFFLSIIIAQYLSLNSPEASFYLFPSRAWELLTGAILANLELNKKPKKTSLSRIMPLIGLVLIFSSFIFMDSNIIHPSFISTIPIVGTALFIWFGGKGDFSSNFLSKKIMVGIGLISYPLYLWHFPLFVYPRIKISNLSDFDKFESIYISFLLAILTYFFVEKPSRRLLLKSKKFFTIIIVSIFFVLISIMGFIYFKKGLPERYPEEIKKMIDFNFDYKNLYQEGTCFITEKKLSNKIPFENCPLNENKKNKPLLYLWGDSNAAHLYPGIKEKYSENYQIIHRSASSCLPLINYSSQNNLEKNCKRVNKKNLEELSNLKIDLLFLAGFWSETNWNLIEETVNELKKLKIKNIHIVGPVPRWGDPLPKEIMRHFRKHRKIPKYLNNDNHNIYINIDKKMKILTSNLDVKYHSPISILCNEKGCLTRVDDSKNSIIAWDESHLTEKGSIYLINNFKY